MKTHSMFMDWETYFFQEDIIPQVHYRFSAIPSRIPGGLFAEIDKLTLKFYWNSKDPE